MTARAASARQLIYLGGDAGWNAAKAEAGDRATVVAPRTLDSAGIEPLLTDAIGVIDASMRIHLDASILARAPSLLVISCATTGSDHIDRAAADRLGIAVHTLRDAPEVLASVTPAAELTWALVLACARRLPAAVAHVNAGGWDRDLFPGVMLRGKRLGIIGCGRIGGWVGRYGDAFGMDVVGVDPYVDPLPHPITRVPIDELLSTADVLTVHVHLAEETRGLLGAAQLASMKPGAILVNTSRGALVDEPALVEALDRGHLGAVGLDVLDGEPDTADHPLVRRAGTLGDVIITPHIGGNSPDAVALVVRHATRRALEVIDADQR